jgi:uncharacterized protein DUF664
MRAQLLATVAATDPAGDTMAPPAPWHGIFDARPIHARYYLVHLVEECARHAGHADIIREQIQPHRDLSPRTSENATHGSASALWLEVIVDQHVPGGNVVGVGTTCADRTIRETTPRHRVP